LAKAQQLARMGRYHDAGPLFAKAAELAPDQPEPLLGLAESEQKDGNYTSAANDYRRAFALAGDVTSAVGLAKSLVFLGQLAEAKDVLEAAERQHGDNSQLHFELSRVYARLGEKDSAAEQVRIVERLRQQAGRAEQQAGTRP
jgi:Flp pilus assembly protein TadD